MDVHPQGDPQMWMNTKASLLKNLLRYSQSPHHLSIPYEIHSESLENEIGEY